MTLVLWLLPTAIFAIGLVPMLAALRTLREEADAVRGAAQAMRPVRLAYVEAGGEFVALRRDLARRLRSRG